MKFINIIKKGASTIGVLSLGLILFLLLISVFMYASTNSQVFDSSDKLPSCDYVMVLGCGIVENQPSWMLRNRLDDGIIAYKKSGAKHLILSGSVDGDYYDEVSVMKNYVVKHGISESVIIEDKGGDDTFLSIKNSLDFARDSGLIVVTQDAHLRRAMFLANSLGAKDYYGVRAARTGHSASMLHMELREILARVKAILDIMGISLDI